MEPKQLDPKHSGELLKHLDKQNEFLMDSYKLMFNELQKLQVEEEMLMRKLYEVMTPHGPVKKADNMEAANRDDMMDKHVENEQNRMSEIADGDDTMEEHVGNEQCGTSKIVYGDDSMDKHGENEQNTTSEIGNEQNRTIEIDNGDDTMDNHEQNRARRSTRELKKSWKLRTNDE